MDISVDSVGYQEHFLRSGLVSRAEVETAERIQAETGQSFLAALRNTAGLEANVLAQAVADFTRVPLVSEDAWRGELSGWTGLSIPFLRDAMVFPLPGEAGEVLLAMEDPTDEQAVKGVALALKTTVVPRVAAAHDIHAAIDRVARRRESGDQTEAATTGPAVVGEDGSGVEHLRDLALGAPVVRYVNVLLQDAVHARATDIHIEPFEGRVFIRMRVDGMLRQVAPPPPGLVKAITSRVKILSGMNIAERRLPQDGRARVEVNQRRLDLRVATMPTIHGEAVAIRLLDNVRRVLDFSKLGFGEHEQATIKRQLMAPHGLIIITGPTGSGKTTTLATSLHLLNQVHRKILTVEDPIEYEIEGVNQTQTKPAIGLSFANTLRSFLRHDPDVLMVGEMRDGETAGIGVHAALTGHLVLTSLHTNTAAGAVPRLLDMGVDAFLLASCLRCVVGQRLVRVLCPHCRTPYFGVPDLPPVLADAASAAARTSVQLWRAGGCERCFGTGYHGRTVISEVMEVGDAIRAMIRPGVGTAEIELVACERGLTTMLQNGLAHCRAGITTIEEVRRVALDI
jgi:general secretion pathway protein E